MLPFRNNFRFEENKTKMVINLKVKTLDGTNHDFTVDDEVIRLLNVKISLTNSLFPDHSERFQGAHRLQSQYRCRPPATHLLRPGFERRETT